MRFVIVTGMSGAGKTTALKMLEDMGYFCVDNLPISLIEKFAELTFTSGGEVNKVALGIDIRSGQALGEIEQVLERLTMDGRQYEILFLDAADDVLVKRYKETRRVHPLAKDGRVDKGIALERERLVYLKQHAEYIIDTSRLLTRELKGELEKIFVRNQEFKNLVITVLSFGFKYGIPADSDLVFDVRFLPNPYYIDELKAKSGNDKEVQDYVMGFSVATELPRQAGGYAGLSYPELYSGGEESAHHQYWMYRRQAPVGDAGKPPLRETGGAGCLWSEASSTGILRRMRCARRCKHDGRKACLFPVK